MLLQLPEKVMHTGNQDLTKGHVEHQEKKRTLHPKDMTNLYMN
jgi:hypothetical protein